MVSFEKIVKVAPRCPLLLVAWAARPNRPLNRRLGPCFFFPPGTQNLFQPSKNLINFVMTPQGPYEVFNGWQELLKGRQEPNLLFKLFCYCFYLFFYGYVYHSHTCQRTWSKPDLLD
jgi:hypothetical protein